MKITCIDLNGRRVTIVACTNSTGEDLWREILKVNINESYVVTHADKRIFQDDRKLVDYGIYDGSAINCVCKFKKKVVGTTITLVSSYTNINKPTQALGAIDIVEGATKEMKDQDSVVL